VSDDPVAVEKIGRTSVVTLNRPKRKNALDRRTTAALADAFRAARDDRSVSSVVITGAGGDFCAGADLLSTPGDGEGAFAARNTVLAFHRMLAEVIDLEKPVIAAVDGVVAGAGLALALAADFVVATPGARLLAPFMRIGLVPDLALLYLLPRLVGLAKAKEIVFSAREVLAPEALEIGLVQAVVAANRLRDAVLEYAGRFDNAPIEALGVTKTFLNRAFETDRHALTQLEASAQSVCAASAYHQEALRRFLAKEMPLFGGVPRIG
jgi:2-(1,2-epoxy-1,2-dihydrophenyl)acetyl-CoA isomerase